MSHRQMVLSGLLADIQFKSSSSSNNSKDGILKKEAFTLSEGFVILVVIIPL